MNLNEIVTVIASVIALVSVALKIVSDARKDRAENDAHEEEVAELRISLTQQVVGQASDWLKAQGLRIAELRAENEKLQCENVALKKEMAAFVVRLDELESRDVERAERVRELKEYSEYLLAGIRVLIRQVSRYCELPEFDPVGFTDFITGDAG